MYKAYNKRRKKRTDISDDETEASADEGRADPGTAESEQTASAAEETLGRGTRRAATSTDYGGPVTRRRRADRITAAAPTGAITPAQRPPGLSQGEKKGVAVPSSGS